MATRKQCLVNTKDGCTYKLTALNNKHGGHSNRTAATRSMEAYADQIPEWRAEWAHSSTPGPSAPGSY